MESTKMVMRMEMSSVIVHHLVVDHTGVLVVVHSAVRFVDLVVDQDLREIAMTRKTSMSQKIHEEVCRHLSFLIILVICFPLLPYNFD